MNNAELFKQIFGEYATAIGALPENEFLEWLNADVPDTNVGDAISRQAAIDAVCSVCGATDCKGFKLKMFCPEPYAIQKLPSAEPEIIRCKDCKYQGKGSNNVESWNLCRYRPWLYFPIDDEHFCGYAKRRMDGESDA